MGDDEGAGRNTQALTDNSPANWSEHISVFDPDFGDSVWIHAETGLQSGDWEEISEKEHANL